MTVPFKKNIAKRFFPSILKATWISYLFLSIAIILWASAFVGIRIGLKGYTPGTLAIFRFLIVSIIMIPLYFRYRTSPTLNWKEYLTIFLIGFFGVGIYHLALNFGELTVSAGLACFIIGTGPIFASLLAFFILKEKLTLRGWVGIGISFIGIMIIAFDQGGTVAFNIGTLCILISSLTSGLYSVLSKLLLKKVNAIELVSLVVWSGTISLLIFLPGLPAVLIHASLLSTLSVVYLGIFPGAIAYITWSIALAKLPVAKASSFLYAMPILSTLLGWALLNEKVALFSLAGGFLAMAGSFIVQSQKHDSSIK